LNFERLQVIHRQSSLFYTFLYALHYFFALFYTLFYPLSLSPKGKNKGKLLENRRIAGAFTDSSKGHIFDILNLQAAANFFAWA